MDIIERAKQLRATIEGLAEYMDDTAALESVELFAEWKPGTTYEVGTRVRYNDLLYKCIIAHTSQESWNPEDAPSLWTRVLIPDPEVIPAWEQPDSTNPYMKGDKVKHNEKTWISDYDNNVWEPGVFGWTEVTNDG